MGEPREKHLEHPHAEFGLSHLLGVGLEHTSDTAVIEIINEMTKHGNVISPLLAGLIKLVGVHVRLFYIYIVTLYHHI